MMTYKFYDTNALLLKSDNLFEENTQLVISSITLKELENIKTSSTKSADIKYTARKVLRLLDEATYEYEVVIFEESYLEPIVSRGLPVNDDARILACALHYDACVHPDETVFVTNDLSLKVIANLFFGEDSIESVNEEYEDDYNGYFEIILNEDELIKFYSTPNYNHFDLIINQYLIIYNKNLEIVDRLCWTGSEYRHLDFQNFKSKHFGDIRPKSGDVYQQLAFDSLSNNQITMLKGPAGTGKAQPNSTKIPMADGTIKLLGDIVVGDYVLDRTGKPTQVLAVYPQGYKDNYRITFSDNRQAYCNDEHLWSTYTSKGNLKTRTLREMIDHGFHEYKNNKHNYFYQIPINQPIEYPEQHYDIDPYVMGCFLGDGCCKQSALTISSQDDFIVKEIGKIINGIPNKNSQYNYNWEFYYPEEDREYYSEKRQYLLKRFNTKKFFNSYLEEVCTDCYLKKIPHNYKLGSISQRKQLLQGLLDTDGTIDKKKGRIRFTSTSLSLVKDLQEICWSLGYIATINQDERIEKYPNTQVCYNLSISCSLKDKIDLFRLPRKKNIVIELLKQSKRELNYNSITIKNIEKLDSQEEMTCILVDNEEHLYLTENYIVTHNSYLGLGYLFSKLERGKIDKIIIFCNTVAVKGAAKLGFYPGSRDEKILDSQIGNFLSSKLGDRAEVERMIQNNELVLLPMADARGFDTTGMRAGIYITEAQNMDIELMKLALQRIGEDSICILDGDYMTQLDDVSYAGANNGMRRVSQVFRGNDIYGEVELKNIYRSKIAQLAQLM